MSDFKPINSQEELDAVIKDRLARESKKYADYDELKKGASEKDKEIETLKAQVKEQNGAIAKYAEQLKGVEEKDKELATLKGQVKDHEINSLRVKIAHEVGLPYELAGRLSGDNEEAITKDAKGLKELLGNTTAPVPGVSREPAGEVDTKRAALKTVLDGLKQGGI